MLGLPEGVQGTFLDAGTLHEGPVLRAALAHGEQLQSLPAGVEHDNGSIVIHDGHSVRFLDVGQADLPDALQAKSPSKDQMTGLI